MHSVVKRPGASGFMGEEKPKLKSIVCFGFVAIENKMIYVSVPAMICTL